MESKTKECVRTLREWFKASDIRMEPKSDEGVKSFVGRRSALACIESIQKKGLSAVRAYKRVMVDMEKKISGITKNCARIAGTEKQYKMAVALAKEFGLVTAPFLQHRLGIGYNEATKLIDLMENHDVVGAYDGVGHALVPESE